jgi:hypothetical protein
VDDITSSVVGVNSLLYDEELDNSSVDRATGSVVEVSSLLLGEELNG